MENRNKLSKLNREFRPQDLQFETKINLLLAQCGTVPTSAQGQALKQSFLRLADYGTSLDTICTRYREFRAYLTAPKDGFGVDDEADATRGKKFVFTDAEVAHLIKRQVQFLAYPLESFQRRIVANVSTLQERGLLKAGEMSGWAHQNMLRYPRLFMCAQDFFARRLDDWEELLRKEYHFNDRQIATTFKKFMGAAGMLAIPSAKMGHRLETMKTLLNWDEHLIQQVLTQTPIMLSQSTATLCHKYQVLRDSVYHLSNAEINQMTADFPPVLSYRPEQLTAKTAQVHDLQITRPELVATPRLLAVPVGHLLPRYAILRQVATHDEIMHRPNVLIVNENKTYARLRHLVDEKHRPSLQHLSLSEDCYHERYHAQSNELVHRYPLTPKNAAEFVVNMLMETNQKFAEADALTRD